MLMMVAQIMLQLKQRPGKKFNNQAKALHTHTHKIQINYQVSCFTNLQWCFNTQCVYFSVFLSLSVLHYFWECRKCLFFVCTSGKMLSSEMITTPSTSSFCWKHPFLCLLTHCTHKMFYILLIIFSSQFY